MRKVMLGICALAASGAASGATLVVDNGQLIGATGVQVGTLGIFNVSFEDGSCQDVYGACDIIFFDFDNFDDAFAAAAALRDQVFLDTVDGAFDSRPELTRGCVDDDQCNALIPFFEDNDSVNFSGLFNDSGAAPDRRILGNLPPSELDGDDDTWARFSLVPVTPPPAAVPEPATWAMMVIGFGLAGAAVRRRRAPAVA